MAGGGGMGGGAAACATANGFIKVLDPNNQFSLTDDAATDTTNATDVWEGSTVELLIDAAWEGQLLQYGFQTNASDFVDSGVFYDNVVVNPGAQYTQDFELLDISATTIGDDWLYFVNVFDGDGTFKFGFNTGLLAPNGPQISALVTGQGGVPQGDQQLSVYSDYECCQGTNEGHFNGTDLVETNVFRERTIDAADVGTTIVVSFDAKRGNINNNCP